MFDEDFIEERRRGLEIFINKVAGAIHRSVPTAKVSTGAHSIPYNTNAPLDLHGYENTPFNYYNDQSLIQAGGDPLGTMDFYQVHGYPEWNDQNQDKKINMFLNPKSKWKLDKPLIVGEHWNEVEAKNNGQPVLIKPHHYRYLRDNGYAGAWGWAYFYVREYYDHNLKTWVRWIDHHQNTDDFRKLFEKLPRSLKDRVNR